VVLSREACEGHLLAIARVFEQEGPDVVALQEADGPSAWSGDFDHVAYLAEASGYRHREHGLHIDAEPGGSALRYGTALVARRALANPDSGAFRAGLLDTKGYLLAEYDFVGRPIAVVSVHLDFKTAAIRMRQARALVERLRRCELPLVVMGDFNTGWNAPDDALRLIAEQLNLQAYQPTDVALGTFPAWAPRARLDWILISRELEFRSYRMLPRRLSDHLGVVAEIGWRTG
jgi:endonuclease/exonuclease/phosphatase family metal-dependent hydrolase